MEDTNRRYYKKVLVLFINLLHICFEDALTSPIYSAEQIKPFYLDFLDLAAVGIIEGWNTSTPNSNGQLSS